MWSGKVGFGLVWLNLVWFGKIWFGLVKVGVIWLSLIRFHQSMDKQINQNNYETPATRGGGLTKSLHYSFQSLLVAGMSQKYAGGVGG